MITQPTFQKDVNQNLLRNYGNKNPPKTKIGINLLRIVLCWKWTSQINVLSELPSQQYNL